MDDRNLEFDHHLDFLRRLGALTGDRKGDAYCYRQAEHMHALSVCDAIRDVHIAAAMLSESVRNSEADFHLRFGVARRTKFIWLSLRRVLASIPPARTEPLIGDDLEEVARDLNVIYLNIRGALDNIASTIIDLFGSESSRNLPPIQISLFGQKLSKDENLSDIIKLIEPFRSWNKALSGRRDPAAHRIPLSVPPAILDPNSRKDYEAAIEKYHAAFGGAVRAAQGGEDSLGQFEKARALFEETEKIGLFVPVFVHHPDDGLIPIYPTVPTDIAQLTKIARSVFGFVEGKTKYSAEVVQKD
jgi:hypothetical protein